MQVFARVRPRSVTHDADLAVEWEVGDIQFAVETQHGGGVQNHRPVGVDENLLPVYVVVVATTMAENVVSFVSSTALLPLTTTLIIDERRTRV